MQWYWLVCGILMLLMEFGIKGKLICFFGLSALIAGAVYFFHPLPLLWQFTIFGGGGVFFSAGYHFLRYSRRKHQSR